MKLIYILIIVLVWISLGFSQDDGVPALLKGSVYGIINYGKVINNADNDNEQIEYTVGNSVAIYDSSLGLFLITCKHLIKTKDGSICDSIAVKDRVKFGNEYCVTDYGTMVYLRKDEEIYYYTLDDQIDLAAIQLTPANTSKKLIHRIKPLPFEMIECAANFPFIDSHTFMICYPKKEYDYNCQDIKLGRCLKPIYIVSPVYYTEEIFPIFIMTDIPTDYGDSGAPVFSYYDGRICLVGIHHAIGLTPLGSYEISSSRIYELLENIRLDASFMKYRVMQIKSVASIE